MVTGKPLAKAGVPAIQWHWVPDENRVVLLLGEGGVRVFADYWRRSPAGLPPVSFAGHIIELHPMSERRVGKGGGAGRCWPDLGS
jgi:hypothetical protein